MMMGRPIRYTPKEIETTVLRGRYMLSIAERELGVVDAEEGNNPSKGVKRFIKKEPLGVVLAISGTQPPTPLLTLHFFSAVN
jgi:acyl-CoA reductase-like NAD-dependent aldehyde dehydrogenase